MGRLSKKKLKKLIDKECYLCGCDDYDLLHVHRIIFGCDGGKYDDFNMLTVCVTCHTKIHRGTIKIDRKYSSTSGKMVLHYWIDGKEYWK